MTEHLETGKKGEELATEYLRQKLYTIVARNWRHSRCEVDIIARDGTGLVFVEVKTRTSDDFGHPEESVDPGKQGMLLNAAQAYLMQVGEDLPLRFDVISVRLAEKKPQIEHFEDAFYPIHS
jgi:putative endonuclease